MLNVMISTLLQLGVVLVIAGIVYFVMRRPDGGFLRFVGLTGAPARAVGLAAAFGLVTALAILATPGIGGMAGGSGTVAGDAAASQSGASLYAGLAIAAIFKTALSEELLFRGLIGKRLIAWLGFVPGNIIQAVLFGAVHLLLLLVPTATPPLVAFMVLVTGVSGWVSGWINDRMAGGSILPGWAAHAVANLVAYAALAGGFV